MSARHGWIFARGLNGSREYWTGRVTDYGLPIRCEHISDAYVFESHESAMRCAETHRALRNSDEWKVVQR